MLVGEYVVMEQFFQGGAVLADKHLDQSDNAPAFTGFEFPMLYCYRHYLELALKSLIPQVARLSGLDVECKLDLEHSLLVLWREFRRHAKIAWPPHPDNEPTDKIVERLINEMNQFDSNSQATRYYLDKKGKPFKRGAIDVKMLRDTMASLHSYFLGCDAYTDQLLSMQADLNAEYVP